MENRDRDRDKMSRNTGSTSGDDVSRDASSKIGQQKSGSSADFGQKIGRSEHVEKESSRKSGSGGMQGDSGRSSGQSWDSGESDSGDLNRKSGNRSGGSSSNESL